MRAYIIYDEIENTHAVVFGDYRAALAARFPEGLYEKPRRIAREVRDLIARVEYAGNGRNYYLGIAVYSVECEPGDLVHPCGYVLRAADTDAASSLLHSLRTSDFWSDMPDSDVIGLSGTIVGGLSDAHRSPSGQRRYEHAVSRLGFQIAH